MHISKSLHYTAFTLKTFCTLVTLTFLTGFGQLITIEIYREIFIDPYASKILIETTEQKKTQLETYNSRMEFTTDGTLYLVYYNMTIPGLFGEGNTIVKDSNNNIVFSGKEKENPYSFIQWSSKEGKRFYYNNIERRVFENINTLDGEFTSSYAVPMVNSENKRTGHWLWDTQRYFKYYNVDGSVGGYIGANGFKPEPQQVKPFDTFVSIDYWLNPNSYDPMLLYQTEYAIYQIDFRNKQVETLVNTPNDPIRSVKMNNWRETDVSVYRPTLTIVTKSHKMFVFLKNPKQSIEILLPPEFHYYNTPAIAATGDKIWAKKVETAGEPKTNDRNIYLSWYMENQDKSLEYRIRLFELYKNESFLEKNSFTWTGPKQQPKSVYQIRFENMGRLINSFSSPLTRLAYEYVENCQISNYHELPRDIRTVIDFSYEISKFYWPVNLSTLAVFAFITLLHSRPRQTSAIKLAFWIAFVALFNLAGFLTYLAYNHTPVVQCSSCGKRRNLEQDACCRCGAALPLPKSRETDLITRLSA